MESTMRVLMVALALAVTPLVAGVSQNPNGSRCDNGKNQRSAEGTAHAHKGQCATPTPPPPQPPPPSSSCPVTGPLNLGSSTVDGAVRNGSDFSGLAGWCIRLTGTVSAVAITDAAGNYSFSGLPDGTYTVCEDLQTGWQETFPGSWSGASCVGGWGWTFGLFGFGASALNFLNTLL